MSLRVKEVPVPAQAAEGGQGGMAKPTCTQSVTQHCSEKGNCQEREGFKRATALGESS